MISLNPQSKIFVGIEAVDFRKGLLGLKSLCKNYLQKAPDSGAMFVFRNKRKDAIKVLCYDGQGYWLMMKRLSSGRNVEELLSQRKKETKAIFVSEALPGNLPKGGKVLWGKCNVHARRNFWDYRKEYPKMVSYVLSQFSRIYRNEARAIQRGLSPNERLKYHQKHSQPIMEKLRRWGLKNLYLKKIEPNEELGKALKYFFKHYPELTLYLRVPGVPLDNNITERLLKVPILNRKNSYFYKTEFGALVGDIVMSLTQTCKAAGKNPFKYLVSLHENKVVPEVTEKLQFNSLSKFIIHSLLLCNYMSCSTGLQRATLAHKGQKGVPVSS